jgi:transposase
MPAPQSRHVKAMTILANRMGFSNNEIAKFLSISRGTVRKHLVAYETGGVDALFSRTSRPILADDESLKSAIFTLLHEPPSIHCINRTSWRLCDLQNILNEQGHKAGRKVIQSIIKQAGYRWRSAKVVLTSKDPEYRKKLDHIQSILSGLKDDERFFSVDEFGPFSIKAKPGRVLAPPGFQPSVPQWQKSKGWLILTAALELSTNRVTHFYSKAKNTNEMIRMARLLVEEYKDCKKLYLSWDAASWHLSKRLIEFINEHNAVAKTNQKPLVELAPLPASAQFLNVIESVFSGMSRAIIHNSNYSSVQAAKDAIDQYFSARNKHYKENPKRAGKKIWGHERVPCEFNASSNCKDPAFR